MPKSTLKNDALIVCPDCYSEGVRKKSSENVTNKLNRSYFTCCACGGTIRVLTENGVMTDLVMARSTDVVSLILLAIRRLNQEEKNRLLAEVGKH